MSSWENLHQEIVSCRRCPRLVDWREQVAREKRRAFMTWDYWGKPVPGFGDSRARLLIIGLAPGAHGSNRTGRMFTGDSSGDTLTRAMWKTGFANQPESVSRDDGLQFKDAYLTAVARCAPPNNRPVPEELTNCRQYLLDEIALLDRVEVVLALGHLAFQEYQKTLASRGYRAPRLKFSHGEWSPFPQPLPSLVACYHPSRQNTQTGRLTVDMLDAVFHKIRTELNG
ncbi:MAG: uracil-DNA glycosylase [Anaerolineales bacterium]